MHSISFGTTPVCLCGRPVVHDWAGRPLLGGWAGE